MSEGSKLVKSYYKRYLNAQAIYVNEDTQNQLYWDEIERLHKLLIELCSDSGYMSELNKNSIILLIVLQRKLRFLPEHKFYMAFDSEE